jgi:glycosyltransferase involved in cell wall biosynthesis
MNQKVSIIIPTYNRVSKVIKCLDSIVQQTYQNIEMIVVDDGSTDGTDEVIQKYIDSADLTGRLKYFKQINQGAPAARNFGLSKALGSLVVFFDSDDLMYPDRIVKQVDAIIMDNSDSCACGYVNSGNGIIFLPGLDKDGNCIGSMIHWTLRGSTQCWMYKKDILQKIGGYDSSYACYQDWDLTFRYMIYSNNVSIVKESLGVFVNDDSLDRITNQVNSVKRLPHIQRYYLKVLSWLVKKGNYTSLANDVIFSYVHQVTFSYYRAGDKGKAFQSYSDLASTLKDGSFLLAIRYRWFFYSHLLKRSLK